MSTTLMQQTTFDTTSPVRPSANIASTTFENIDGPVVYHKNPVGANHIFRRKQGKIVGYENESKKRAIVAWNGIKKHQSHNSTSLCRSPTKKKTRKKAKKRKRVIVATIKKKLKFNNSSSVSGNQVSEASSSVDDEESFFDMFLRQLSPIKNPLSL